jgi:predicted ATPase
LNEALKRAGMTGEQAWQAEIHRINGLVLLAETKLDEGQALLHHALEVARKQQAKSLELRASMSLARLWRAQGKVEQARELLAPVYGWFTEGFGTRDLKEAKALLEELAA